MGDVAALAAQWTHGEDGARKRLREMIDGGLRFDARDRMALAYLLEKWTTTATDTKEKAT